MTDDALSPQRADILKIGGPKALTVLSGDVMRRLRRSILALQNTDLSLNSIGLVETVQPVALLHDATRAPFRLNGKAWQQGANLAAGAGGNFTTWEVENPPFDGKRLFLAVVDWLEYQGASVAAYGIVLGRRFTTTDTVPALEDNGIGVLTSYVRPATVLNFVGVNANVTAFAGFNGQGIGFLPNTGATGAAQRTVLGGDGVGDLVLWPNEVLHVQMATAAVAGTLTVHGRLWDFGSLTAPQLP